MRYCFNKEFGDLLLEARKKAGFSRNEVQEELDLSVDMVKKWEKGYVIPKTEAFLALCRLYEKDPKDFYEILE